MSNHNFALTSPFKLFNSDLERESHDESCHMNNEIDKYSSWAPFDGASNISMYEWILHACTVPEFLGQGTLQLVEEAKMSIEVRQNQVIEDELTKEMLQKYEQPVFVHQQFTYG
jgi:hypothetical protein